jgi:hypothetical protein
MFATKKKITAPDQCMFGRNFAKNKNQKFKNKVVFGGFQSPKGRVGESKNLQISIFGFQCVAKNIER